MLREVTPHLPVTTNYMVMGDFHQIDYTQTTPLVDIVSNDHYLRAEDPRGWAELAFSADRTRGLAGGAPVDPHGALHERGQLAAAQHRQGARADAAQRAAARRPRRGRGAVLPVAAVARRCGEVPLRAGAARRTRLPAVPGRRRARRDAGPARRGAGERGRAGTRGAPVGHAGVVGGRARGPPHRRPALPRPRPADARRAARRRRRGRRPAGRGRRSTATTSSWCPRSTSRREDLADRLAEVVAAAGRCSSRTSRASSTPPTGCSWAGTPGRSGTCWGCAWRSSRRWRPRATTTLSDGSTGRGLDRADDGDRRRGRWRPTSTDRRRAVLRSRAGPRGRAVPRGTCRPASTTRPSPTCSDACSRRPACRRSSRRRVAWRSSAGRARPGAGCSRSTTPHGRASARLRARPRGRPTARGGGGRPSAGRRRRPRRLSTLEDVRDGTSAIRRLSVIPFP